MAINAAAPINNFKTITKVLNTNEEFLYEAPVGYVGVILLSQCINVSTYTRTVSFYHNRVETGIGTITTEIVKDYPVPGNEATNLITGKLVLETGDYLTINANTSTDLKIILSVIETFNQ